MNDFVTTLSYVISLDNSVQFSSPFTGDNNKFSVQNFKLNDAGILACTDEGQDAIISSGTVAEYFLADGMVWRLDRNQMSDQYKTLFNQMQSDCQKAGYGSLQYLQYGWNATENKMAFTFKTNKFEGELKSSEEGEVNWYTLDEIEQRDDLSEHFMATLKLFTDDDLSELIVLSDQQSVTI